MFDLNQAITQWQSKLISAGTVSKDMIDELSSHLNEQVQRLVEIGLSEEEAFMVADHRMGDLRQLSHQLALARPARAWAERALLALVGMMGVVGVTLLFSGFLVFFDPNASRPIDMITMFLQGVVRWPNPMMIAIGCAWLTSCYWLLARVFTLSRRFVALMLGTVVVSLLGYHFAMIVMSPDSMLTPAQQREVMSYRVTNITMQLIAIVTANAIGLGVGLWWRNRRMQQQGVNHV